VRPGRRACILRERRPAWQVSIGRLGSMLGLIIIVLVVLLLGGFGFSRRGR
jgi:hypothetical protein